MNNRIIQETIRMVWARKPLRLTIAVLFLFTLAEAAQAASSCSIAIRLDCLSVSTNRTKRGFPALLPDNQNPKVYLKRDTSYSSTDRTFGTSQNCINCHQTKSTAETWEFNSSFVLSPTNSARSGHVYDHRDTNGVLITECTADRQAPGTSPEWTDSTCYGKIGAVSPTEIVSSNMTMSSFSLTLTNYTVEPGNTNRTNVKGATTTINLSLPYTFNDFLGEVTNGLAAMSFPNWTNATRYAAAERGGINILTPAGEYADFSARMSRVKYRIAVLGPKNEKQSIRWFEVFTPNGGGPVTNAIYTNEITFTGESQLVPFPDGSTEKIIEPPPTVGKTEVFLENKWGCVTRTCTYPGAGEAQTGSIDAKIGLGRNNYGEPAGFLYLREDNPGSSIATPNVLKHFVNHGVTVISNAGVLRQVKAPQALADIVTINGSKYQIRFYSDPGNISNGLYQPSGQAFSTWTVESPSGTNTFRLTQSGSPNVVWDFTWSASDNGWTENAAGLRQETRGSTTANGFRTETFTVKEPSGTLVYKEVNVWHVWGGTLGDLLVTNKIGPDTAPLVTRWSYYTNSATDGSSYGKLKEVVRPNGGWDRYDYTNGRPAKVVSVFTNNPVGSAENLNYVTLYSFAPVDASDSGLLDPNTPRTEIRQLLGNEIGRRYRILTEGQTVEIQCQTPGAAVNAGDNLYTTNKTYGVDGWDGLVESVRSPDGTSQFTQRPTPREGAWITNIVASGQPDSTGTAIADGTQTTTIINANGQLVSVETIAIPLGIVVSRETYGYSDSFTAPTSVTSLDGTTTYTSYDCCGIQSTTDADGVSTTFNYDGLRRSSSSVRLGITNSTIFDAAGNVRTNARTGTDGSTIILSRATFDLAGRQISSIDALNNTTSFTNINLSLGSSNYTAYPDTGTRIEILAADGSPLRTTGTAVHPSRFEYGVEAEGGTQRAYTKEIKLDRNGNDTSEWIKTYTDMVGRVYKTVYPDGAVNLTYFNAKGQPWRTVDPDGVTNSFWFNGKGEQEYATNGPDRVLRTLNSFGINSGIGVRRVERLELLGGNFVSTSTTDSSTDGLRSWQTAYGRTIQSQTAYGGNGNRTTTTTAPDTTETVQTFQNGRLVSSITSKSGVGTLSSLTFSYDAHGRQNTITDLRNGSSTLTFNAADQVVTNTTPAPAPGQAAQRTVLFYDSMGRVQATLQPDSTYVTNLFYLSGEPQKTFGSRIYPVSYAFDGQGRMTNMTTWQNFATGAGAANTVWSYSSQRGFLQSKTYQGTNGPSYTWTLSGRLQTRTSAKGVVTTYAYNPYGEVKSITYSDGTPGITNGYDQRGRITNIWHGTNLTMLSYNDAGQLLSETRNGIAITNSYDSLLRLVSIGASSISQQFAYDGASRLKEVTNGIARATYNYWPNSSLVQDLTFRMSGTQRLYSQRAYDHLNRLQVQASAPTKGASLLYSYGYNLANQRTNTTLGDGTRWVFQNDALGQLTSGKKYWSNGTAVAGQQFEYSFDDIGNRLGAGSGGDSSGFTNGLNYVQYQPNLLNQPTNRTTLPSSIPFAGTFSSLDIIGSAPSGATVWVNESTNVVYRRGDYWRALLTVNNDNTPLYTNITARVLYSGANVTNTGFMFIPPETESFTFDADGNLTSDSRWTNRWDSESRLISFASLTNTPTNSWFSGQNGFDYFARRISKVVSNWNGSAWVKAYEQRFLYSGRNLIAVLDGTNGLQYSFTWATDLSGTRDGAGGVGGLISMTVHYGPLAGTYFYCFDGNGNVVALVNTSDGATAAIYEYGPFGELIRASGAMAKINPFRFSTKFQDDETGYLYYGYRFYDPRLGRWLSRDPIEEISGQNLFAAFANDPVNIIDRDGRDNWSNPASGQNAVNQVDFPVSLVPGRQALISIGITANISIGIGANASWEGAMRATYNAAEKRLREGLQKLVRTGVLTQREAADIYIQERNDLIKLTRSKSSPLGRAWAEWLKPESEFKIAEVLRQTKTDLQILEGAHTRSSVNLAAQIGKGAGRVCIIAGITLTFVDIYAAPPGQRIRTTASNVGGTVGALSVGYAAGEVGAGIGSLFPGPGTAIGAGVGFVGGTVVGAIGGGRAGENYYDAIVSE